MIPLIMGGSGLFGRKTLIGLSKDPEISTVVSMDVTAPKRWVMESLGENRNKVHFVHGDLADLEVILDPIKAYDIDRLVNWAFLPFFQYRMGNRVSDVPAYYLKTPSLVSSNPCHGTFCQRIRRNDQALFPTGFSLHQ